ncbi:MAG: hypothetical protein AABY64_14985 [Bdellovibrionota bacterium]
MNGLLLILPSFFPLDSQAENLVESVQKYLIKKEARVSLIVKIKDIQNDKYEVSILNGLTDLLSRTSLKEAGTYRIDLPAGSITRLDSGDVVPDGFTSIDGTKTLYKLSNGLIQSEADRVIRSLITFPLASLENTHQNELKKKFGFSSISKNKISPVQNKIYFLVGFLDFLDIQKHSYVLKKVQPYFEVIIKKGFKVDYNPSAKISDLIAALNNEETLAIYWISHSISSPTAPDQVILLDSDKNPVAKSVFNRSFRAKPISLALIACYPEKIQKSYDLDKMVKDRNLTTWYTEGVNEILKEEVIRPVEFEKYISSLPVLSIQGEKHYENQEYLEINFEYAGAFPLSGKYYILLNGNYIGVVPYNYSAGFSKYKISVPMKFFGLTNEIAIHPEFTIDESTRESLVYIKNFSVMNETGTLFYDQKTFRLGSYSSLSFFNSISNAVLLTTKDLVFNY